MKRIYNISIMLIIVLGAIYSCKKNTPNTTQQPINNGTENNKTNPQDIQWNKNKTIKISFASELTDRKLSKEKADKIIAKTKDSIPEYLVVERTDLNANNTINEINLSNHIAIGISNFYVYGPNRIKGSTFEGNTIFINHPIEMQQTDFVSDNCMIKSLPVHICTMVNKNFFIDVNLATFRLETTDDIIKAMPLFDKYSNYKTMKILCGTVKKDIFNDLQKSIKASNKSLLTRPFGDLQNKDYCIVTITPPNWPVRDQNITKLDETLNIYNIFIEADVE